MGRKDLTNFLNKHCHFRFRGGREAYGVIWEADGTLVFSSKEFHHRLQSSTDEVDMDALLQINSDDVMLAEVIA